jgi:hypothetical protein
MSHGVGVSGTKSGNPFVDLTKTFYSIKGVFLNPLTKSECSLPTHSWMFVGFGQRQVMLTSPESDKLSGVAMLQGTKADYEAWGTAKNENYLVLVLLPEQGALRARYISDRIDLEKLEWAIP